MEKSNMMRFRSIFVLLLIGSLFMLSCKNNTSDEEKNTELTQTTEDVNEHGKENTEEATKILSGELRIGHELRAFTPCWSEVDYWIVDTSGEILRVYEQLTKEAALYTPIFVEIEVIDNGKSEDGFSADYEGVYEIVRILESRAISDIDCE